MVDEDMPKEPAWERHRSSLATQAGFVKSYSPLIAALLERAVEWLHALGESLQASEKSKEKADVLHAIYDRITVAGPEIVGVRLTQAAYAHGLALALPEKVEMARPTGLEPATFGSGTQRSIH